MSVLPRAGPAPVDHTAQRAELGRVAHGGALNLAGSAVAAAAGLAVTALVARALPADAAGAFFAAAAAFVLATTVSKLGTQTGLIYWTARLRVLGQPGRLAACLRIGLVPVAAAGVVAAALMILLAPRLAEVVEPDRAPEYTHLLRVLAVFLPFAALSDTLLAATRGYRAMYPTVHIDRLLRPGLQLGAFAGLTALATVDLIAADPVAYGIAWAAPYLPAAVLAALALARIHRATVARPAPASPYAPVSRPAPESLYPSGSRPATESLHSAGSLHPPGSLLGAGWSGERLGRRFWRFTGPRAVAGVAQSALQRVDVLLVAALAGLPAAALYAVAGRFVLVGQLVNQGISQSVQPRLAELLAAGDRSAARTLYQSATAWLVALAWPVCLIVAVFAPTYLAVFGPAYRDGAAVVVVLAVAMLVATACGMVDMVLAMAGRTTWNLANVGLAMAVMVGLDLLLVPRWGALGAALGLAAAVATNNLVPVAQIAMLLRIHPFGRATLTAAALALGCFGVLPLLIRGVAGPTPAVATLALMVGVACYGAGCWRLRTLLRLAAFLPHGPDRGNVHRGA